MTAFKSFRTYEYPIAANSELTLALTGTYFAVLEADGVFRVAMNDMPATEFEVGLKVILPAEDAFSKLSLFNETGSTVTVKFNIGFGDFVDGRFVLSGGINVSKSTDLENVADVTVASAATVTLAAANNARRELLIVVPDTATGAVRVGRTGGVGAASGILVNPGASAVLTTTAQVDCHNPTGASIDIAVLGVID